MHEVWVNKELEPSLLEKVSQLSSDDVRKMLHSKGAEKLEKFGTFLFKKLGSRKVPWPGTSLCDIRGIAMHKVPKINTVNMLIPCPTSTGQPC